MADTPWWKQKVIYQIYPMSFCDSNGEGIGDLPGILSRLDYLQKLGVGALWLSPVYPSPNKDNGYDISDYCNIHPNYGTLQDMDTLIAEAKKRDIRIIMDLVINHTSDQHEWFQKSRRRIEPYTDYYIWRKGEKGKKPTNWGNFFGGDCWEYDDLRGEYYLHLFAKEQPDLNYHNEAVIEAIEEAMHFWLERGVAGFRCDVINIIYKEAIKNGKWRPALTGSEYYLSTPGCHRVLHRLHEDVLAKYDAFTVGETVFVTPKMADDLVNPAREDFPRYLPLSTWKPTAIKSNGFCAGSTPIASLHALPSGRRLCRGIPFILKTTISPARFLASVMIPNIMMKAPRHLPRSFLP